MMKLNELKNVDIYPNLNTYKKYYSLSLVYLLKIYIIFKFKIELETTSFIIVQFLISNFWLPTFYLRKIFILKSSHF